jgi:hypothetical protein
MKRTKIIQMLGRTGQPAANQFLIFTKEGTYFQSYKSIIAFNIQLDSYYWDYSATTGKYRNDFLGEGIADTRAKIESKEYFLTNLNK